MYLNRTDSLNMKYNTAFAAKSMQFIIIGCSNNIDIVLNLCNLPNFCHLKKDVRLCEFRAMGPVEVEPTHNYELNQSSLIKYFIDHFR